MTVRMNRSYDVQYFLDPFCNPKKCGKYKKMIRDAETDPIRIYVDTVFTWENATYVSGRKGVFVRLLVSGLRNSINFIGPNRNWPREKPQKNIIQCIRPFKLDNLATSRRE